MSDEGTGQGRGHDRRFRVLMIDDDSDLRSFFLRVTPGDRWSALAVEGPDKALAALDTFNPDLILLDLSFPDRDGLAVMSELAPRANRAAVMLLSGCDPEVLRSAHRIGERLGLHMHAPLAKPLTATNLRQALAAFEQEDHGITVDAVARALDEQVLTLAYQPKVAVDGGAYRGVEALVRWPTEAGVIMPGRFVPVVERDAGLSLRLLSHVLERAVREADCWRGEGIRCAVNMSAQCLTEPRLADLLCSSLRRAGARPEDFVLELTETAALQDPDRAERTMTALRLRGFAISLDDFGTGHSSLLHLQRMPFNELKIDQTFVNGLLTDDRAHQIVRLVVNLGRTLGAGTVAEGIETPEQADALREMDCDLGQGFLFARPMAPECLTAWRRDRGETW